MPFIKQTLTVGLTLQAELEDTKILPDPSFLPSGSKILKIKFFTRKISCRLLLSPESSSFEHVLTLHDFYFALCKQTQIDPLNLLLRKNVKFTYKEISASVLLKKTQALPFGG